MSQIDLVYFTYRQMLTARFRASDLGADLKTFDKVVEHFSASAEDVRRSAAFAAGNMTVGNPGVFLPTILKLIQSDDKKRYLALQALKEVRVLS